MTRTETRHPARGISDHIRRATMADAALGVDSYAPVEWLTGSGTTVADALIAWADAKLIEVEVGGAFDVVRMQTSAGIGAIGHLRIMGATVGPVLKAPHVVDVLVPRDHAAGWDLPGAYTLDAGTVVAFPHPAVVSPHECNARTWLVTPRHERVLTDGADLYGAYVAALVSLGQPVNDEAA